MNAYDETYLSGAQRRLGAFFDFGTRGLGLDLERIFGAFLASALSSRFGAGDPAVVAGLSGEELALEVMGSSFTDSPRISEWIPGESVSADYWTGWALAFYQWASGYSFEAIGQRISIGEIRSLYVPYHEMDIRQFCDRIDEICLSTHPQTNLQARRIAAGLSQRQLAHASGVPVRTLQQYEQRQKNINRARADYVVSLARALCCNPSDVLEHCAREGYEYAFVALR